MQYKNFQVLLKESQVKKLDEVAEIQERSRSFLLRKAIQDFLNKEVAKRENANTN